MTYIARTETKLITILILLFFFSLIFTTKNTFSTIMQLIFLTVLVLLTFIRYSFTIDGSTLHYSIALYKLKIYEKRLQPLHINNVVFKRAGWQQRLILIKPLKGLPIRLALFKPDSIFTDIELYCIQHLIPLVKKFDFPR